MNTIIKRSLLVIALAVGALSAHDHRHTAYHELSHKDLTRLLQDKDEEINNLHWKLRAARVGWGTLGLLVGCTAMKLKHHLDHAK